MVWGDVKPDNIMIEKESNHVMLVDFGGGFSTGWIENRLQDTEAGDLQGLSRVLEYIDKIETEK